MAVAPLIHRFACDPQGFLQTYTAEHGEGVNPAAILASRIATFRHGWLQIMTQGQLKIVTLALELAAVMVGIDKVIELVYAEVPNIKPWLVPGPLLLLSPPPSPSSSSSSSPPYISFL